jgi:hypothetical protein
LLEAYSVEDTGFDSLDELFDVKSADGFKETEE